MIAGPAALADGLPAHGPRYDGADGADGRIW